MNLNLRVHPSSPQARKGTTPPRLEPAKENAPPSSQPLPPRPDYANLRRPSDSWLAQPAWIDGGVNPPQFYYSQEEILNTLYMWQPNHRIFTEPAPAPAPAPPAIFASGNIGVDFPGQQQDSSASVAAAQTTTTLGPQTRSAPEEEEDEADATPPAPAYQVNVLVAYSAPDKIMARGQRVLLKKHKDSKFGMIDTANLDRCQFIAATLAIHPFGPDYSPGVHSGPSFKISWTGSAGGKSGAVTVDTDHEWTLTVAALQRKSNKPAVLVEYNLDEMDGYRVSKKRPLAQEAGSDDPELLYGTKVPRVDDFTPQDQLNGAMILKIKEKWPCKKHLGENGDFGHCYVNPAGQHIGLNMRKLKIWAAAMAGGDATKHEPPNIEEFDGARDGRLTATRQRSRTGPRASAASSSISGSTSDILLVALINTLNPRAIAPAPATADIPTTPPRNSALVNVPTTPRKQLLPMSPVPTPSSELHACLTDFLKIKAIDILACESVLASLELSPTIIANVPVARLCEITGIAEGRLWSFQAFCGEWCSRLEEKKCRLLLL